MDIRNIVKELRWRLDPFNWLQLIVVLSTFLFFLIIPIFSIAVSAFIYGGSPSIYWFEHLLSDPLYLPWEGVKGSIYTVIKASRPNGDVLNIIYFEGLDLGIILNSILLASLTTLFSSIIGYLTAYLFARYDFPGSNIFRILILTPLLSTPFVGAIGLKKMITSEGFINTLLYDILGIIPFKIEITGLTAVMLIQTLLFYPIIFLNVYTSLLNIDPSLEEQAQNMGAKGFHLFRTVTFPLSLPGLEAGALLVFILSIEDLGTPLIFRGTNADKVMTVQIFRNLFAPTGEVRGEATALAFILLSISLAVFISIRRYISLKRYAMLGKGGIWRRRLKRISMAKAPLIYILLILLLSVALLPHIGVTLLAFSGEWPSGDLLPKYYTFNNFISLFRDPAVSRNIMNSLIYSLSATLLITLLGVSAAYLVSRVKIPGISLLDALVTMPIAIPGIIVASGYFLTFLNTPLSPINWGAPLLIAAYTIRKFPFGVRTVFAGLEQTDPALEEAAINVGASRTRVFFTITIPLIFMNIIAGAMLGFIYSMSEVSTSIVIGDANHNDAPMTWKMYDIMFKGFGGTFQAAAMGFILMTLQFIMIVGSNLILRRRAVALIGI